MTRPALQHRDPRDQPALGDRFRRDFDGVQVDVWHLYHDNIGDVLMVGIVAHEPSGQARDILALDEFRMIADRWRVTFVAGYTPKST